MRRLAGVLAGLLTLWPHARAEDVDLLPLATEAHDAIREGEIWRSTGNDPQVTFRLPSPVPIDSGSELYLEMKADAEPRGIVVAQVFLAEGPKQPFAEERSVKIPAATDGAWHRYRVSLGATPTLAAIRLDPLTSPGTFALRRLQLTRRGPPPSLMFDWRGSNLALEWLPGPGLDPLSNGAYRVRGKDAYLLSPSHIAVDAGRFTLVEVRVETKGLMGPLDGRMCYGPEPLGTDAGCTPVPAVGGARPTTHYVNLLLQPGYTGTIRRLLVEPLGSAPPAGVELRVDWIKVIGMYADPLTSVFVRKAEFIRSHNPTHAVALILGGLGIFLLGATLVVEKLAPKRARDVLSPRRAASRRGALLRRLPRASVPGEGAEAIGPRSLVDACSLYAPLVVICMLAIFPFEFYPLLSTPFLHGQIDIPAVVVLFGLLCGLTRRLFYIPRPTPLAALERPAILLISALWVSCLFSRNLDVSLAYLERHYGMLVAALLAGAWAPVTRATFRRTLAVILIAAGWVAAIGVVQACGLKSFLYGEYFRAFQPLFYYANIRPKAFSTMGHPVPLASYLLAAMPLALYVAVRASGGMRILGRVVAALCLACFLLTLSRGAYLAFVLAAPIMLWMVPRPSRRRVLAAALAITVAAGALLFIRRPRGSVRPFATQGASTEAGSGLGPVDEGARVFITQRVQGARIALSVAGRFPLLGAGLGQLRSLYDEFLPRGAVKRNPIWSTADNTYLTLLAEAGIVGLAALLLLVAGMARHFLIIGRRRADGDDGPLALALLASMVGFFAHLVVYDGLHWFTAPLLAMMMLGLGSAALAEMEKERQSKHKGCSP